MSAAAGKIYRLDRPEGLARCANIPRGLAVLVSSRANDLGFGILSIRADGKSQSLHRARLEIASEAREHGYSFPEIGRALNRDHSTILKNLKRLDVGPHCEIESE